MAIASGEIIAAPRPHGSSPWAEGPRFHPVRALAEALSAEGERRVHWLPVFLGAGIAAYFTLTVEPPWWVGLAATLASLAVAAALRRIPAARTVAILIALAAAGFALIQFAAWRDGTPMLDHRLGSVALTGLVIDVDQRERGWRVIVAPDPLPGLVPDEQPRRVRISIPPNSDPVQPGDRVRMRARLYPAPAQVVPGGWDLQRALYFAGIGAVGYSFGPARRVEALGEARGVGWRDWLQRLRNEMTARINAALPGSTGGVASALITGKRGTMSEEVAQGFRDSGLAHLLVISGLHLALVGGFVFRDRAGGLALIPFVALRYPIKKIAAALALTVMFFYLLISGAAVPTERAFVMNGIVFAAILIDRLRISMRICVLAAMVVLVLEPASLIGVSFQMSFGAVVALIAVYEAWGSRLAHLFHGGSFVRQVLGLFRRGRGDDGDRDLRHRAVRDPSFPPFRSVRHLANVIAVPISAMWTLPWGLIACLLMPFGLETFGLIPMGWGIEATIWTGAMGCRPAGQCLGDAAPADLRSRADRARRVVAVPVARALAGLGTRRDRGRFRDDAADPPARYRARRFRPLAGGARGGRQLLRRPRRRKADALVPDARDRRRSCCPGRKSGPGRGASCTVRAEGRCFYTAGGRRVALVTSEAGLPVACDTVDAIVAQVPAGFACRSLIPIVDRIDNWRQGAVRAVARSRRHHRRERQCQPRRPALGAASGLGPGACPPCPAGGQARRNQEEPPAPEPRENE